VGQAGDTDLSDRSIAFGDIPPSVWPETLLDDLLGCLDIISLRTTDTKTDAMVERALHDLYAYRRAIKGR